MPCPNIAGFASPDMQKTKNPHNDVQQTLKSTRYAHETTRLDTYDLKSIGSVDELRSRIILLLDSLLGFSHKNINDERERIIKEMCLWMIFIHRVQHTR